VCLAHLLTNTAEASASIVVRNALFLGRQRVSEPTIPVVAVENVLKMDPDEYRVRAGEAVGFQRRPTG
jgi:plastocyanin